MQGDVTQPLHVSGTGLCSSAARSKQVPPAGNCMRRAHRARCPRQLRNGDDALAHSDHQAGGGVFFSPSDPSVDGQQRGILQDAGQEQRKEQGRLTHAVAIEAALVEVTPPDFARRADPACHQPLT